MSADSAPPRGGRYHHGDLRRALLDAAVEEIIAHGPAGLSLRALARAAGVSHAAPVHHFGDKAGLVTTLAVDGFERLAEALAANRRAGGSLIDAGVAYVRFAVDNRAHFEVMFRPELLRSDDRLNAAAAAAYAEIVAMARAGLEAAGNDVSSADLDAVVVAAWSTVHGYATLSLQGLLPLGGDLDRSVRPVLSQLRFVDLVDPGDVIVAPAD